MFHAFRHPIASIPLPERFTDPFHYTPHPLCVLAAGEVQSFLANAEPDLSKEGKMFGVLIVRTPQQQIGFLAAFSGILAGSYLHPYFVPPVYNLQHPNSFFRQEEQNISTINEQIRKLEHHPDFLKFRQLFQQAHRQAQEALSIAKEQLRAAKMARDQMRRLQPEAYAEEDLIRESQHRKASYKRLEHKWKANLGELQNHIDEFSQKIEALKTERKQRSAILQEALFAQFRFLNARGEIKNLSDIFRETVHRLPPAGAGECAAPKLLQYAYLHHFHPLAMAEFWWGSPSKTEIRRQGIYYPACKGKCEPILTHMLQGLLIEGASDTPSLSESNIFPEILYEDEWLLVIDKPAGLLSVPGKTTQISVYDLTRQHYPNANGPLIVHRLDMATSGLLLIAKTKKIHEHLQRQFLHREIRKRYVALLEGKVQSNQGCIDLPLCADPADRPRQIVHEQFGKPAVTRYQVISRSSNTTRIYFYPETGRTHQLRVHAAHPSGLNCPILGDSLYGHEAERLYLHAEYLEFTHPITGEKIQLEKKADF